MQAGGPQEQESDLPLLQRDHQRTCADQDLQQKEVAHPAVLADHEQVDQGSNLLRLSLQRIRVLLVYLWADLNVCWDDYRGEPMQLN